MARAQSVALIVAIVCGVLGLATSTGCPVLPETEVDLVAPLHGLVILVGAVAGVLMLFRSRQIDDERWRVVEDPALTSGEREYAHKEAEAQKKSAGVIFVMAPLTLGFWMAAQFRREGTLTAADFLALSPLAGIAIGLAMGWWLLRGRPRGPG